MPTVKLYRSAASVGLASGYLWSFHPIPRRSGAFTREIQGRIETIAGYLEGCDTPSEVEIDNGALGLEPQQIAERYLCPNGVPPCSPPSSASSSPLPAAGSPPSSSGAAPRPSDASAPDEDDTAQERANDQAIADHDEMLDSGFRSVNPALTLARSPAEADRLLGHPQSPDRFDWEEIALRMQEAEWIGAGLKHRTRKVILPWPEGDRVYSVDNLDEIAKESALRGWESRFGDAGIEIIERKPFRS